MMIEDWEVGRLFWRLRDQGKSADQAAAGVKQKFLDELCGAKKNTHFYVGTHSAYPRSWLIVGLFYPRVSSACTRDDLSPTLF